MGLAVACSVVNTHGRWWLDQRGDPRRHQANGEKGRTLKEESKLRKLTMGSVTEEEVGGDGTMVRWWKGALTLGGEEGAFYRL